MSDHDLRDLRRELATLQRGRGKQYPAALRRRITGWARRQVAGGVPARIVANALALHPDTVRKWLAEEATSTALVPVEVIAEVAPVPRGLRVVSPAGYRVDGLELDEVAALLKVLG